ncbi:MAG: ROK family protein [Candidatus Binataceae bacterium]
MNQSGASPHRIKRSATFAIDVGGAGIKALTLDAAGKPVNERSRIDTPPNATPKKVIAVIQKLACLQPRFDRVAVGFPGVIKKGVVYSAPNLGAGWRNFPLAAKLAARLRRPVRVANDADVQGLASVSGRGIELVITLGTGFGSVLFLDGRPIHLELAHHPFRKGKTYEDELGFRALKRKGGKKWNRLLRLAIADLAQTFNYDRLYIGGGNARHIKFRLPPDARVVGNQGGLLGGIKLWTSPALQKRA